MQAIKPTSNTISLGATGNTIFLAKTVYIHNANGSTSAAVTANTVGNATTKWVVTIPPATQISIIKDSTDLLSSNITINATGIAFSY